MSLLAVVEKPPNAPVQFPGVLEKRLLCLRLELQGILEGMYLSVPLPVNDKPSRSLCQAVIQDIA